MMYSKTTNKWMCVSKWLSLLNVLDAMVMGVFLKDIYMNGNLYRRSTQRVLRAIMDLRKTLIKWPNALSRSYMGTFMDEEYG